MTKTPDEIKKGLACCAASIYQCADDCPYRAECRNGQGGKVMNEDALALIQQLQAEKAEQAERIRQLEAERDAAVGDVHKGCETCKNSYLNDPKIDICRHFRLCQSASMWEWRGVQKEDSDD